MSVHEEVLLIELTVPERVLSLHGGTLAIPVRHVVAASAVPNVMEHLRGDRMPGSGLPGRLAVGSWCGNQGGKPFRDFVIAHRPGPGVVVSLVREEFDRIVLGVPHPEQLVADLGR